jgi:hypothetical protein
LLSRKDLDRQPCPLPHVCTLHILRSFRPFSRAFSDKLGQKSNSLHPGNAGILWAASQSFQGAFAQKTHAVFRPTRPRPSIGGRLATLSASTRRRTQPREVSGPGGEPTWRCSHRGASKHECRERLAEKSGAPSTRPLQGSAAWTAPAEFTAAGV